MFLNLAFSGISFEAFDIQQLKYGFTIGRKPIIMGRNKKTIETRTRTWYRAVYKPVPTIEGPNRRLLEMGR